MKHFRKLKGMLCMAVAAVLCAGLAAPAAYAAETDTGTDPNSTYEIFQVFTGDYQDAEGDENVGGKVLANVKWGTNGTGTVGEYVDSETLEQLEAVNESSDYMKLVDIERYVDFESTAWKTGLTLEQVNAIADADPGYYLVRNVAGSVTGNSAYTSYVVKIIDGHFNITPKTGVPTVDKKTEGDKTVSDAAIGDVVTFTLTATLPENMGDYHEYYLEFVDTMSKGLSFQGVTSIMLDGEDVKGNFYINNPAENGNVLRVVTVFPFAVTRGVADSLADLAGKTVVVTYTAEITSDADISKDTNTNEVKLVYSNDPKYDGSGWNGPDTPPTPPEHTGETVPTENTKTYTWLTGLTVSQSGNGKPLSGSEFVLTGENIKTVITYTDKFELAGEGKTGDWYKLKQGGYTNLAPTAATADQYMNGMDTKADYVKIAQVTTQTLTADGDRKVTMTTNDEGVFSIAGLKSGHYKLENTKIPAGYNLAETVEFDLTFDDVNKFSSNNALVVEGNNADYDGQEWFYIAFASESGTMLPETGGSGTTMLYVGGGALAIVAIAFLALKARRKTEE